MNIQDVYTKYYKKDAEALSDWCQEIYDKHFNKFFDIVHSIARKMSTDIHSVKLSDSDLESILIDLPIELFQASESLNQLRLEHELIKMAFKTIRESVTQEVRDSFSDAEDSGQFTKREIEDSVRKEVERRISEHGLLIKAYETVIARVENERSSCRELIMSAKKIWDSRRSAEQSNPVKEVVPELPDYDYSSAVDKRPQSYIR